MKSLEEKIIREGKVLDGDVLKIDCFLNHQIDVRFMEEMGKEFKKIFDGEKITKILTIEASGIAIAYETSKYFDCCPVVFAKKVSAKNQDDFVFCAELYSYTRQRHYTISVAREYISKDDSILIIDDFLANGQALKALIELCKQAGCKLVGCGVVVEKAFQLGGKEIRDMGIRVESLAKIKSMSKDHIEFDCCSDAEVTND